MMLLKATGEPRGNSSSSESTSATMMQSGFNLGDDAGQGEPLVPRQGKRDATRNGHTGGGSSGSGSSSRSGGAKDIIVSTAGIK